jgi:hypothetical protein
LTKPTKTKWETKFMSITNRRNKFLPSWMWEWYYLWWRFQMLWQLSSQMCSTCLSNNIID